MHETPFWGKIHAIRVNISLIINKTKKNAAVEKMLGYSKSSYITFYTSKGPALKILNESTNYNQQNVLKVQKSKVSTIILLKSYIIILLYCCILILMAKAAILCCRWVNFIYLVCLYVETACCLSLLLFYTWSYTPIPPPNLLICI